ncbi:MAG: PEP-utilizing enzyme [Candidatus Staskawiczbacteria bacterium]|jgi:phosphohistidine swiveling domain-containing protein
MINQAEIIRKIRGGNWWQGDGPVSLQLTQPPYFGFARMRDYFKELNSGSSPIFLAEKDEYGYQIMAEEDNFRQAELLVENDRKDKRYIAEIIGEWKRREKEMMSIIKLIDRQNLTKLPDRNLYNLFFNFREILAKAWAIPLMLEGSGMYFEKKVLPEIAKASGASEPTVFAGSAVLTTSEQMSFSKKEHLSILKIAERLATKKAFKDIGFVDLKIWFSDISREIAKHQKNFYWVRNNYSDETILTEEDFFNEVKDIVRSKTPADIEKEIKDLLNIRRLRDEKRSLKKTLKLSKDLSRQVDLFAIFGYWQDERKRIMVYTTHYLASLLKEISRRMEIDYRDGYHLSDHEISGFLSKGERPDMAAVKDRKRLSIIILPGDGDNSYHMIDGKEAEVYSKEIFDAMQKILNKSRDIKGYVASTGGKDKVQGKVSVVLNIRKDAFETGNVLVTSMTRPEFIPLIKLAKAIITSEGGVTSHAAIVSREMNVPCVIGTKVATNVLKNGDNVEIDLKTGIVKIIK